MRRGAGVDNATVLCPSCTIIWPALSWNCSREKNEPPEVCDSQLLHIPCTPKMQGVSLLLGGYIHPRVYLAFMALGSPEEVMSEWTEVWIPSHSRGMDRTSVVSAIYSLSHLCTELFSVYGYNSNQADSLLDW